MRTVRPAAVRGAESGCGRSQVAPVGQGRFPSCPAAFLIAGDVYGERFERSRERREHGWTNSPAASRARRGNNAYSGMTATKARTHRDDWQLPHNTRSPFLPPSSDRLHAIQPNKLRNARSAIARADSRPPAGRDERRRPPERSRSSSTRFGEPDRHAASGGAIQRCAGNQRQSGPGAAVLG